MMNQSRTVGCVIFAASLVISFSPASCTAHIGQDGQDRDVKTELEREYAAIVRGFKENRPAAWIDRLAPEFQLKLFNGSVQSRKWAVDYVSANANVFRIDSLSMSIKLLIKSGPRWVATVEQLSSRTWADSTGTHRLEVGAIQLETWGKTAEGWKLFVVQEKEVLYLRRDGQSG